MTHFRWAYFIIKIFRISIGAISYGDLNKSIAAVAVGQAKVREYSPAPLVFGSPANLVDVPPSPDHYALLRRIY